MKLLYIMLLLIPVICNAQTKNETILKLYLNAYHEGNISEIKKYISTDVEFHDVTAKIMGQELKGSGKVFFATILKELFSQVSELKFESEFEFTSAQFGVSGGTISYIQVVGGESRKISYKVISIIELDKESKVKKHIEYADYESAIKSMSQ